MKLRFAKYLFSYSLPLGVALSFSREGWLTFVPVLYGFGLIPLIELLIPRDDSNLADWEAEIAAKDRVYDWLLWLMLPVQVGFLLWFFLNISSVELFSTTFWGRTTSMALMCGVLGINVAHELGHRRSKGEKLMAKILLFSSLYPHFFIEHNYGHHKRVATPDDPASARPNESLFAFWLRSLTFSYLSAWHIEAERLRRRKREVVSWGNEMIRFTIIEVLLLMGVLVIFGPQVLLAFILAAVGGMLLLETVNYIEHYGLQRHRLSEHRYEKASPLHSWNSNHMIGRMFLFELSRHSDHHAYPHKKYQLLDHHHHSPQMPTGYPGMMLLSLLPPLWFSVMNKRVKKYSPQLLED